jgi:hypothetical protein
MKRRIALVLPLTVVLLFGFTLGFLEAQQTPLWQMTLDRYLQAARPAAAVRQVERATMPWLLTPAMHGQVVDYGDYCYHAGESRQSCTLALPYPPQDVYCALVTVEQQQQLLLVSRFSDNLWRDDWVILASPSAPSLSAAMQTAATTGCEFARQEPP